MLSIPSSLVEESLALMYRVASDKRVAFRGRIKHFQRMRFPAGTNTGKGKPATFTFTQFMQLVLAFELVQSGLAPTTAALIVSERWGDFGTALARTMVPDEDVIEDPKGFPSRDLMFVVYFDAMWQLGVEGPVSDETEYYGAVKIVEPGNLALALLDEEYAQENFIESPWRSLVIDARWLAITAFARAFEAGVDMTEEAALADLIRGEHADLPYNLQRVDHGKHS